jgi:dihydroorotase
MTGSKAAAAGRPYDGVEVTGWPVGTIIRGRRVVWDGAITDLPANGAPVRFWEAGF